MGRPKVIKAGPPSWNAYLQKVWQYRGLVIVLARRDIKAQFAQTFLGWGWMILKPMATLLIFTVFFGELLALDTGTVPYPAFAFSGMLIWYLFAGTVQTAGLANQQASDLIHKTYFPKIILPFSKLTGQLIEFSLHLVLLLLLLLVLGLDPNLKWFLSPLFLIPAILSGMGLALWLNVLTLRFRDLQHILPHLVNFAIWFTPVFYPGTIIPETYRELLYYLNPIASAIEALRWATLDTPIQPLVLLVGLLSSSLLFLSGAWAFARKEHQMTDMV